MKTRALLLVSFTIFGVSSSSDTPPAAFIDADVRMVDPDLLPPGPEHANGVTVRQFVDALPGPRNWEVGSDGEYVVHSRPNGLDNVVTHRPFEEGAAKFVRDTSLRYDGHVLTGTYAMAATSALVKRVQMDRLKSALR